jgi:hypothetical protein
VFAPDVPSFLPEDRVWSCTPGGACNTPREEQGQLFLVGSNVLVQPRVPAVPIRPTYDSTLAVHWRGEKGFDAVCSEEFDARIEFLDRMDP